MIRRRDAHKHYPRDTRVIRKGDADWKSDRENYVAPEGTREDNEFRLAAQRHIANPTSVMDGLIRQRNSREVDTSLLPSVSGHDPGDIAEIPHGRDLVAFRLVEVTEATVDHEGDEYDRVRRYWRRAYVSRNANL